MIVLYNVAFKNTKYGSEFFHNEYWTELIVCNAKFLLCLNKIMYLKLQLYLIYMYRFNVNGLV